MQRNNEMRRVVVTGYGAITPLGSNAQASWQAIMDYQLGYGYVDKTELGIKAHFLGLIAEEPSLKGVPAAIRRRLPRFARLTLGAAREAMSMAFGESSPLDFYSPLMCGAIMGTGWGGLDESYYAAREFALQGVSSPFNCFYTMPNVTSAACSQYWNLRGYQNTVVAACATGTVAIGDAFEVIRSGRANMMLAGAGESLTGDGAVWNIDVLGALCHEPSDPLRASCPFSAQRNGFVLSEGASVLCLEERESALARGATILGEVTGYGNFSDAFDFTSPAEDCVARVATIKHALEQAGLAPEDLDYINAHGTSTELNDKFETMAIKAALGDAAYKVSISSTKGATGHGLGAAGGQESIVCIQAIQTGVIPPTINYETPDPNCDLDITPNTARERDVKVAMNINLGFGGHNGVVIYRRFEK